MEIQLAKKLEELELNELIDLLTRLRMADRDAFEALREQIDDLI
jgi:hypothetical protein